MMDVGGTYSSECGMGRVTVVRSFRGNSFAKTERDSGRGTVMVPSPSVLFALRTLGCEHPSFSILALWGNKNGLPSMKVKELENLQNKSGFKGCKWSSLNAPGTETPLSHPYTGL